MLEGELPVINVLGSYGQHCNGYVNATKNNFVHMNSGNKTNKTGTNTF
jgi:hypothetical protein